jgi:hypothetical protein
MGLYGRGSEIGALHINCKDAGIPLQVQPQDGADIQNALHDARQAGLGGMIPHLVRSQRAVGRSDDLVESDFPPIQSYVEETRRSFVEGLNPPPHIIRNPPGPFYEGASLADAARDLGALGYSVTADALDMQAMDYDLQKARADFRRGDPAAGETISRMHAGMIAAGQPREVTGEDVNAIGSTLDFYRRISDQRDVGLGIAKIHANMRVISEHQRGQGQT